MSEREKNILKDCVIKTLLYFDIFNYPLRVEEVYKFLGTNSITKEDVHDSLLELVRQHYIFQYKDLFSVQQGHKNFTRRINGNKRASTLGPLVQKRAKLIASFPFVRAVLASGSYAKDYMDETSDLDFFVVTKPDRLWIARTLLVLYKRIFLFNSHKYFCCNYFIDTEHLEIEEKNLFTATELATLIPLYDSSLYVQLMEANGWLKDFFPNYKMRDIRTVGVAKSGLKKVLEKFLDGAIGNKLEKYFMNITLKRWKKLYEKKYPAHDFEIAFKTRKHVSKNHPNHFQKKIMECYSEKLKTFNRQYEVTVE